MLKIKHANATTTNFEHSGDFLENNLFRLSCKLAKHEAGGRYSPLFPLHLNNKIEDRERGKQFFPIMPEVVFMRGYNCVQQCVK